VDNIIMDLREVVRTDLVQDRGLWRSIVNMVRNLQVPKTAGKFE
jgi:hypothetical protein